MSIYKPSYKKVFVVPVGPPMSSSALYTVKKKYQKTIFFDDPFKHVKRENKLMDLLGLHGPRRVEEWLLPSDSAIVLQNPSKTAMLIPTI